MPRANRYFVPGYAYHLTHRCHNRQFLLRFALDRDDYRLRLRQAVGRYDLSVLDYCLTSNHVHLLAFAEDLNQISEFMQKVAGEFGQAYNRRKARTGAYWGDRFHSTIVEPGQHLQRCMVYIALNMVRCGKVRHPREWAWSGYQELIGSRQRFRILDVDGLLRLLGNADLSEFRQHYESSIRERLAKDLVKREPQWTESIAVGSQAFVEQVEGQIKGRQVLEIQGAGDAWILKEAASPYRTARNSIENIYCPGG